MDYIDLKEKKVISVEYPFQISELTYKSGEGFVKEARLLNINTLEPEVLQYMFRALGDHIIRNNSKKLVNSIFIIDEKAYSCLVKIFRVFKKISDTTSKPVSFYNVFNRYVILDRLNLFVLAYNGDLQRIEKVCDKYLTMEEI